MLGLYISLIHGYTTIASIIDDSFVMPAPENAVSITFDDGPHQIHTDEILDILREKGVRATFFVIGLHISRDEGAIVREIRDGHTLGGHSYSHKIFSKLDLPTMASEVGLPAIKIFSLTGQFPRYFRFPYGVDDIRVRRFTRVPIIGWDVDGYDWKSRDVSRLTKSIVDQTKSGSIVLLHDVQPATVQALPMIIDGIRAKGLVIVPLEALLREKARYKNTLYHSRTKEVPLKKR